LLAVLSWADTAASTFGRLFSQYRYNPRLPRRFGPIPFAASKSLAGFIAAWVTGFCVALIYYGDIGGPGGGHVRGGEDAWRVLDWKRGVFVTGMIVGGSAAVTEALGELVSRRSRFIEIFC
jgi:diacylglycerol kinase (CTP)